MLLHAWDGCLGFLLLFQVLREDSARPSYSQDGVDKRSLLSHLQYGVLDSVDFFRRGRNSILSLAEAGSRRKFALVERSWHLALLDPSECVSRLSTIARSKASAHEAVPPVQSTFNC